MIAYNSLFPLTYLDLFWRLGLHGRLSNDGLEYFAVILTQVMLFNMAFPITSSERTCLIQWISSFFQCSELANCVIFLYVSFVDDFRLPCCLAFRVIAY